MRTQTTRASPALAAIQAAERLVQRSEWAGRRALSSAEYAHLLSTLARVTKIARQLLAEAPPRV